MTELKTEVGASFPTNAGYQSQCLFFDVIRTEDGLRFRLKCKTEGSSFSALVPAQKLFVHRGCFEDDIYSLMEWFAKVEPLAWEVVNVHHGNNRPDKIFLVIEQTLTSGYAITHSQTLDDECELRLSARIPLPKEGDANVFMGYKTEKAHATFGFEVQGEELEGNKEYAIFLTIHESFPIQRLRLSKHSKLHAKVKDMKKYLSFAMNCAYGDRYFIQMNKKYDEANKSTGSSDLKSVTTDSGEGGNSGKEKQEAVGVRSLSALQN
jgi:hypothetical protein